MSTEEHKQCQTKLIEIGSKCGFYSYGRSFGKRYHRANPDCVWYYKGEAESILKKLAAGDEYDFLPVVAFEVADSEQEKGLRGSLMSLQLIQAAVGVIVLVGKSRGKYADYIKELALCYSYMRVQIWTDETVNRLYEEVQKIQQNKENNNIEILRSFIKEKHGTCIGEKTAEDLKLKIDAILDSKVKIAGRSYKTGKKTTLNLSIRGLLFRP